MPTPLGTLLPTVQEERREGERMKGRGCEFEDGVRRGWGGEVKGRKERKVEGRRVTVGYMEEEEGK